MISLTAEHLKRLAPNARQECRDAFLDADNVLSRYGINQNGLRLAHFMAQVFHESGGLCIIEENLSYKADRLMVVWPTRFPTLESAQPYAKNPEKLANKVYGGRKELGNTEEGDGWKFIGRGLLQITGRWAYDKYGKRLGVDLCAEPKLAADPRWSLSIAAEEWTDKNCNPLADADDIKAITKKINGGLIGFEERQKWLVKTKGVWAGA